MIKYVTGDATDPIGQGSKIIAHVCNDMGRWGRGFVLSLSQRWSEPERQYKRWFLEQENMLLLPGKSEEVMGVRLELGRVQYVFVDRQTSCPLYIVSVANMIAQRDTVHVGGMPPIRYDALETCLKDVAGEARSGDASVHMPRIGCGLAGGEWSKIELIIEATLGNITTFIYDFTPGGRGTVAWQK